VSSIRLALEKSLSKTVAIGLARQVCSTELSRLKTERANRVALDEADKLRLPALREELRKAEGRTLTADERKEYGFMANFIKAIHSGAEMKKDLAELDKKITNAEACVNDAFSRLRAIINPPADKPATTKK
jgi:hypothetical protein